MGRFRIAVITLLLSGACLAQSNMPFKLLGEHLIVVQGSL